MIIRADLRRARMARRRPWYARLWRHLKLQAAAWRQWHATVSGSYRDKGVRR